MSENNEEEMIVTPWEVRGEINYDKLIEQFGVQPMTNDITEKITKHAGFMHMQLRRGIYLSHRDTAQILEKCINAPDDLRYDIFFALSNNRWGYRDLEHSREVLGYVPEDSADVFM